MHALLAASTRRIPYTTLPLDANTLVPVDLTDPGWAAAYPADSVTVVAQPDVDGGPITSYLFNSGGTAAGKGQVGWQFVAQGTTTTITVRAKQDPAHPLLNTVGFVLYNSTGGGGLLGFSVPGLTPGFADYTFSVATVIGTAYRLALVTNQPGLGTNAQARMVVAHATVAPTAGAVGVFAAPFARLNVNTSRVLDSDWFFYYPAYSQWTTQARLSLKLFNASSVAVEISAGGSPAQNMAVKENHAYAAPILPVGLNGALEIQTITPPNGTFEIIDGPNVNPSSPGGTAGTSGDHVRALYVPTATIIQLAPPPTGRHIVTYGDSITAGIGATTPGRTSDWAIIRDLLGESGHVTQVSWGGRSLFEDWSLGGNSIATLVADIAALAPDDVSIAIGTNDKSRDDWAASGHVAQFETVLAQLFVALHAALPNLRIWARPPPPNATAGVPNASGETLVPYQTAYTTAAAGKPYVTVVSMASVVFNFVNYNIDGVHPTDVGYAQFAAIDQTAMSIM